MTGADQPWAHLIDVDEVLRTYAAAMARYGGLSSPPKVGCVESSLGAAWNAEAYAEHPGSPGLLFASCLLFYLAKNHCFADGNKRISWASAMQVLGMLGLTVDVSVDDAEAYVLALCANPDAQAADVTRWIAERLTATS